MLSSYHVNLWFVDLVRGWAESWKEGPEKGDWEYVKVNKDSQITKLRKSWIQTKMTSWWQTELSRNSFVANKERWQLVKY